jgi:hypothetical protein
MDRAKHGPIANHRQHRNIGRHRTPSIAKRTVPDKLRIIIMIKDDVRDDPRDKSSTLI